MTNPFHKRRPKTPIPPVTPEGRINAHRLGLKKSFLQDAYHFFMLISWGQLLLILFSGYLVVNTLFAIAYFAVPGSIQGARPGHFADAFFFSVHTISTVGYGTMSPHGLYAHTLVALEAFSGLLIVALGTGLTFSKFSLTTARVMFAKKALVTLYDGRPTLMIRMANERASSQIVDARVRAFVLKQTNTSDGHSMRRIFDLPLQRDHTPVFALSFSAIHTIDENSSIFEFKDHAAWEANEVVLIVSLRGVDETSGQMVHARHYYTAQEILFGHRYVDVITRGEDGLLVIDYNRFHDTEQPHEQPSST